jgi:hypothetical protein
MGRIARHCPCTNHGRMARFRHVQLAAVVCGVVIAFVPSLAEAQDVARPLVWDIARSVLIDPTTYAPAALSYEAQRLDWKTSQVFLDRGWLEQNPRFTISGRPNDVAMSYKAGNQEIRSEALARLQWSVSNNVATGICERILIARYPEHRKLFHVLSWVERISVASYVSYLASIDHFRQASRNRQRAREYGYSE